MNSVVIAAIALLGIAATPAGSSDCSVDSSIPVTEIFRYQAGRWVY